MSKWWFQVRSAAPCRYCILLGCHTILVLPVNPWQLEVTSPWEQQKPQLQDAGGNKLLYQQYQRILPIVRGQEVTYMVDVLQVANEY